MKKLTHIVFVIITLLFQCNIAQAMFLSKHTDLKKMDDEIHKRSIPYQNRSCLLRIQNEIGSGKYDATGGVVGIKNNRLFILTAAHLLFENYDLSQPETQGVDVYFDSEYGRNLLSVPFKVCKFLEPVFTVHSNRLSNSME